MYLAMSGTLALPPELGALAVEGSFHKKSGIPRVIVQLKFRRTPEQSCFNSAVEIEDI